ncbi:MAG: MFS transporter [Actinomycetota bacterium]|nr:MFS transporter [Actinomycetota bacterium]
MVEPGATTSPTGPPGSPAGRRAPANPAYIVLIALSVGLALADASVVVLALPELYATFGVSLVEVSWVITSYNVAVVAGAAVLLAVRVRPGRLTAFGSVVFAVSSVVCGVAPSFAVLVAGRAVQGLGAACLLIGSLPFLVSLTGSEERARSVWGGAGALGVAAGPALGGVLTQLFSWRGIFWVQAPLAALALIASLRQRSGSETGVGPAQVTLAAGLADVAFVALFASLVGALFLSVLLFIVVWGYSPLNSAVVVSVLALGTLAVGPLGRALPRWVAALSGGWMLSGGLLCLAWLPATNAGYAASALGFCGCGFGLVNAVLERRSLPEGSELGRPGNLVIGAKHVGFVLGLLVVAPALAGALTSATRTATANAAAVVLDAPLELKVKVPLALDMKDLVGQARRGELPDLRGPFDRRAGSGPAVTETRDEVTGAVEATITRAFRPSFVAAALFAVAATIVAVGVALEGDPE